MVAESRYPEGLSWSCGKGEAVMDLGCWQHRVWPAGVAGPVLHHYHRLGHCRWHCNYHGHNHKVQINKLFLILRPYGDFGNKKHCNGVHVAFKMPLGSLFVLFWPLPLGTFLDAQAGERLQTNISIHLSLSQDRQWSIGHMEKSKTS